MKLNVLIIDDEPLAQKGLEDHINEIDFLELIGKAEDPLDAAEILSSHSIDLILLDIEMPRMNGISFLQKLKNPPLVIICSAHPGYALESYEFDVIDYLLKPISFDRFTKAAIKAKEYSALKKKNKSDIFLQDDYFYVKCNNSIEKIQLSSLIYFEAAGNYITIHTKDRKFITYLTLKGIEEYLPKEKFIRIHKSYLIPVDKITRIDVQDVHLGDVLLPISRNFREDVLKRINQKIIKR